MGTELLIALVAIFICLLLSAFFSASETAITAVSRARIYHLILQGDKRAQAVGGLRKQKERLISGIMFANNTVNIFSASLATDLAIKQWGQNGVIYATIIMSIVVVIFGDVLPKTYAIQNSEKTALKLAPAIVIALKILTPFNATLQFIIRHILKWFGVDSTQSNSLSSASDVIRGTIELHHHEGQVVKQDRDMLGTILDLDAIEVGEIMIHRMTMETIDADLAAAEIIAQAIASTHSRIPIWQNEPDNIIGVLHVKTLIKFLRETGGKLDSESIKRILVKPWFIPESTALKKQLHAFRAERQHLALVVDEYGALQGLVTLEDIIEEIVGRIDDEHDKLTGRGILPAGKNTYVVLGTVSIRDLNREVGWSLPDSEASTVAGLVIHEAQLIPEMGQRFEFHNTVFTILNRQGNQITKLRVQKLAPLPEEAAMKQA
jgi:Mg2+/Co2+ transporter CorB